LAKTWRIVTYLDGLPPSLRYGDRQAKVNAFPLAAERLGDDVREPHKGVILQSQSQEELRPFVGRTLLPSVLRPQGGAFKGELWTPPDALRHPPQIHRIWGGTG